MRWFSKRHKKDGEENKGGKNQEKDDEVRETIDLMKQMIMKEKGEMDFICSNRPQVKMKRKSETAKGMDFILRD